MFGFSRRQRRPNILDSRVDFRKKTAEARHYPILFLFQTKELLNAHMSEVANQSWTRRARAMARREIHFEESRGRRHGTHVSFLDETKYPILYSLF
jgi:hypothetical protein